MPTLIYRHGCPLCDALQRMGIYADDIEWWQARVDAWGTGKPEHATNGWTLADDKAGLWFRQRDYAEEQAKAIGAASQGYCLPAVNTVQPKTMREAA